jgi:hypothetical protein
MPSHLTESEIQALIVGGISSPHVSSCEACRILYHQYRDLFNRLDDEPPCTLSPDFPKRTVARAFPKPAPVWPKVIQSVFILAACATVLGLLQAFVGMVVFRQGLNIVATLLHSTWIVTLSTFKMVHDGLGKGFGMVLQAGLVLFTLGFLDRMWRRVRSG